MYFCLKINCLRLRRLCIEVNILSRLSRVKLRYKLYICEWKQPYENDLKALLLCKNWKLLESTRLKLVNLLKYFLKVKNDHHKAHKISFLQNNLYLNLPLDVSGEILLQKTFTCCNQQCSIGHQQNWLHRWSMGKLNSASSLASIPNPNSVIVRTWHQDVRGGMGHAAGPDIILKIQDQFKFKSKGNVRKWTFLFDKN